MKEQMKRGLVLLLVLVMVFTAIPYTGMLYSQAAEKINKQVYNKDGYSITFKENSKWDNGFKGQFIVENNSGKPIENWKISFSLEHEITSIWDGEIENHKGNQYVIKYPSWNSAIPNGEKAVVGFNGKLSGKIKLPANCELISGTAETGEEEPRNYLLLSNQAESSKPEVEIPKEDLNTVEETGEIVKSADKLLKELHSENPAEIASKIKELDGVKDVIQNGYYLSIVFDTGITANLMISTEEDLRKQLCGGQTEEIAVYGRKVGDGDANYYSNLKILEEIERTKNYNSDETAVQAVTVLF